MKTATVYRLNDRAIAEFGAVAFRGTFDNASDQQIWTYFQQLAANDPSTCYGGVRIEIQNSDRR